MEKQIFHTEAAQTLSATIQDFTAWVTWCLGYAHLCSSPVYYGEMGGAWSTHQSERNFIHSFGRKNLRETDHWEDLGVDGGTLIWTLRNRFGECGLDTPGSEQRPVAGSCDFGNQSSKMCREKCASRICHWEDGWGWPWGYAYFRLDLKHYFIKSMS